MNDPYAILGISKNADAEEIKKAYRKLAKQYHPDRNRNDSEAERKFKEVGEAYKILSDSAARAAFDQKARQEGAERTRRGEPKKNARPDARRQTEFDIANMAQDMAGGFERYFGFDPKTGKVTREDKLNVNAKKNPLDTTEMFESFFSGFKR